MVELSDLETKLCKVNHGRQPYMALYLYRDPTYYTIYNIMRPYKNYPNWSKTIIHNWFNKTMTKLCIEVEHSFTVD